MIAPIPPKLLLATVTFCYGLWLDTVLYALLGARPSSGGTLPINCEFNLAVQAKYSIATL